MARIASGPLQRALVVEEPSELLDELLIEGGFKVDRVRGSPEGEDLIAALARSGAQVLFKRSKVALTREVLERAPSLLAVQLCCIGDDSVDKQACADHGVLVFNDPISNGRSVVELCLAHVLSLSRRLYETDAACRRGEWDKSHRERFEVQGKVLGIVGLGNIGRQVARMAEGIGMQIRFFDTRSVATEVGQEFGWSEARTLDELFRTSDYVTLHVSADDPSGRSNAGLITRDTLWGLGAERPPSSPRVFINLARGGLVAPADLLAAVQEGKVRRAAVDVYPQEPRLHEAWVNPYRDEPRVAVTPHIGAATQEAQPRIARRVAQTMGAFSRSGALRDCVYSPRLRLAVGEDPQPERVLLAVAHATTRGTKRAIDDAIFSAGASNLSSMHRDFDDLGMAYDLAVLDRPLSQDALLALVENAKTLTGDPQAIRSVRQIAMTR